MKYIYTTVGRGHSGNFFNLAMTVCGTNGTPGSVGSAAEGLAERFSNPLSSLMQTEKWRRKRPRYLLTSGNIRLGKFLRTQFGGVRLCQIHGHKGPPHDKHALVAKLPQY